MDDTPVPIGPMNEQNLFNPSSVDTTDASASSPSATATPSPSAAVPSSHDTQPGDRQLAVSETPTRTPIAWSASEYIVHNKTFSWYGGLAVIAVVVIGFVWLLSRDIFVSALLFICALLLGVYAGHKPRQLHYELDEYGLTIGEYHHGFSEFRSFSVVPEGAFSGIELVPLKRFAMYTTIYFDPTDEEKIVSLLGSHLPMEPPRNDPIDQLMRRIRF